MTIELKPIPTRYNGYNFRSRAEARWAVLLDHVKVPWSYEQQGFDLNRFGRYLPDFWLPKQDAFLEVKPHVPLPDDFETLRAVALAIASHKTVWVVGSLESFALRDKHLCRGLKIHPTGDSEESFMFGFLGSTPPCDVDMPKFASERDEVDWLKQQIAAKRANASRFRDNNPQMVTRMVDETDWLGSAISAARSARFEHGESGAT